MKALETVEVLKLSLHGLTVGHLAGYQGGRNILVFDPAYMSRIAIARRSLCQASAITRPVKTCLQRLGSGGNGFILCC